MQAARVLCTFMQYSVTYCSSYEVASDVITGVAVEDVDRTVLAKFCDSTLKLFLQIFRQRWKFLLQISRG